MKFTFAPESKPLEGYTIKRAIYRGGFGEVYYALTDAGREVALKLLQNNTEIELRGVQQCLNLSHPNLVTIFDIRTDGDGDHWIVMEYVAGETLDKAIRRCPNGMPMEEIRRWLKGMADGVSYLHENALVHRDLKPANIFSDTAGVKVGDVGLSKFITPSRRSAQTQSVGTVYYMAPEVAKGRYGKEVDVYALGIILFEMLTGHVPFEGDSTGEILMKHLTERPDLRKLPPRLRPVIGRALEKDPMRRFAGIQEFAQSFDDAVLGRSGSPSVETEKQPACGSGCWTKPDRSPKAKFRDAQWERPQNAHWKYPETPGNAGDFFSKTMKWLALALLFSWIGWGFMVPIAVGLAALFGFITVWNFMSWSANGLAHGVRGAFRDARYAASTAGWAAKRAAGAAVVAPRAAGHAMHAAAGFCSRKIRGVDNPLPPTPAVVRWTQWTGSAAIAPLIVAALTAVFAGTWPLYAGHEPQMGADALLPLATFATTALLASWAIMGVTKYWDGARFGLMSRLGLGIMGLAVGAVAWHMEQFLNVGGVQLNLFKFHSDIARHSNIFHVEPSMLATMVFFGSLFLFRNWMKQTTIHRRSRLKVRSLAVSSAIAALIAIFMEGAIEPLMIWGAVVSATVQLSSAWSAAEKPVQMAA